jgi:flagellar basal body-associated protein FliL
MSYRSAILVLIAILVVVIIATVVPVISPMWEMAGETTAQVGEVLENVSP